MLVNNTSVYSIEDFTSGVKVMSELNFIRELWYGVGMCVHCVLTIWLTFFSQVDWTEPWLLCLLGFHLSTFVGIVLLREHMYAQAAILAVLGM